MNIQEINTFKGWMKYIVDNDIFLKVPSYQRSYAWEEKNIQTLLQDLLFNKEYFLGTFLVEQNEEKDRKKLFIVDGQQRLTTIYMVLFLLNKIYKENELEMDEITLIDLFLEYKGSCRLLMQGDENSFFFKNMLEHPSLEEERLSFSKKKLKDGYDFLQKELKNKNAKERTEIVRTILKSRILLYPTQNNGTSMLIFELLNDRGKQLTQLESLKSFIMYRNYILSDDDINIQECNQEIIQTIFSEIYKILDNIKDISHRDFDEDDILRYYYIAFENWRTKEDYSNTKDSLKETLKNISNYSDILGKAKKIRKAFQMMENLIKDIYNNACSFPWMKNLYLINKISSFYPLLISVRSKYPRILDKVCNYLELFSYRAYALLDKRTDTGISRLYALARKITFDEISEEDIFTELENLIKYYTTGKVLEKRFQDALEDPEFFCSHGSSDTRYLLVKYENYLQELKKNENSGYERCIINNIGEIIFCRENKDALSVEHIVAQDLCEKEDFADFLEKIVCGADKDDGSLTFFWEKTKQKYTADLFKENFLHSLGNLVISKMPSNASKGCKEPWNKEWSSYQSQLEIKEMITSNKSKRKKNRWRRDYPFTVDEILERKKRIVNFAKEYWSADKAEEIDTRLPLI